MKKILLLLYAYGFYYAVGQNTFIKSYYNSYLSITYCVQQTSDSGYIVAGVNEIPIPGLFIYKTNISGDTLWSRNFSNPSRFLWPADICETENGHYLITGVADSASTSDAFILRIGTNGNIVWNNIFDVGDIDAGYSIVEVDSGCIIMTGYCDGSMVSGGKLLLLKTDSAGNILLSKTFQGNLYTSGHSIIPSNQGSFFITGIAGSSLLLMKLDSLTNLLWAKTYDGVNGLGLRTLNTQSDTNIILAGYTNSAVVIACTDSIGNIEWIYEFQGHNIILGSISDAVDGGYIVSGSCYDTLNLQDLSFIFKLSAEGDTVWAKNYSLNVLSIHASSMTIDGGIIFSGALQNYKNGLIKTDSSGSTNCGEQSVTWNISSYPAQISTPILTESPIQLPTSALTFTDTGICITSIHCSSVGIQSTADNSTIQLIPNPTSGTFHVAPTEFRIENIFVYNLLGEKLITTVTGNEINLTAFPDGFYIIEVSGDNFNRKGKILKQSTGN